MRSLSGQRSWQSSLGHKCFNQYRCIIHLDERTVSISVSLPVGPIGLLSLSSNMRYQLLELAATTYECRIRVFRFFKLDFSKFFQFPKTEFFQILINVVSTEDCVLKYFLSFNCFHMWPRSEIICVSSYGAIQHCRTLIDLLSSTDYVCWIEDKSINQSIN